MSALAPVHREMSGTVPLVRRSEERVAECFGGNEIRGSVHLPVGQEAAGKAEVVVGVPAAGMPVGILGAPGAIRPVGDVIAVRGTGPEGTSGVAG